MKIFKNYKTLLLSILFISFLSCEKEEIAQNQSPEIKNVTESTYVKTNYRYIYNGTTFSEKEWNDKCSSNQKKDYIIIGVNENLYAFDTMEQANSFKKNDLNFLLEEAEKSIKLNNGQNSRAGDTLLASANVTYSITLYNDINYAGLYYQHYVTTVVNRWRESGLFGSIYLTGNTRQFDLPLANRRKISSCKLNFIKGGSVLTAASGAPVYLKFKSYLRAGVLADGEGPSFATTLYTEAGLPSTRNVANLTNYRMYSAFGVVTWNDQIQSVKVKIE